MLNFCTEFGPNTYNNLKYTLQIQGFSTPNAQLTARNDVGDFCAFLCAKGDNIIESGGAVGYVINALKV